MSESFEIGMVSFYGLDIHRLMSGRIIPIISGNGWVFPTIGPPPTFWPFMVSLGTVSAQVGVSFNMLAYYNEGIMRLKVCWKSNLLLP